MPDKPTPTGSPPSVELARQVEQVEVTDQQRTALYAALAQDPYRGQVKACRDSGIAGTAGQLRDWFKTDPGVQDHLAEARNEYLKDKRLDIDTLLGKVSAIVHNDESQSQWRAVDWAFAVLHKMGAKQQTQVDVNHSGEVRNPDVAAAVERLNALVSAAAVRAAAGRPAGELPSGTD